MAHSHFALLIVLSLYLFVPGEMESRTRSKRILNGLPGYIGDRDHYDVFRYYVYLAQSEQLDNIDMRDPIAYWLGLTSPWPWELVCGGVLLTPSIVQTACHCLANFQVHEEGSNMTYAFPKDPWEDRIYSYYGSNVVQRMRDRLRPKYYMVYAKCKLLKGLVHFNLHDYGLIVSDDSAAEVNPQAPISYTPAYPTQDILKFHYEAQEKEFMCLLVGCGLHQSEFDGHGRLVDKEENPLEIRWGWRTVMSYKDCYSVSIYVQDRNKFYFNYDRDASWICAQSYDARRTAAFVNMPGDSGGPMTCNNVYFSLFSMSYPLSSVDVITFNSPIVHTQFENSADFRESLLEYVEDYHHNDQPGPHPHEGDFTPTPPPNDDYIYQAWAELSRSPKKIMNLLLIIISTIAVSSV